MMVEVLSMTVRPQSATMWVDYADAAAMLAKARADFPDYTLEVRMAPEDDLWLVGTIGMPVRRWLRV